MRVVETLSYRIEIQAPQTIVWHTLTDKEKYGQWVKAFSANSHAEGEWKQGTYIKFLDPNMGGTKAYIEKLEPNRYILARHVAMIGPDGEESKAGEMVSKWVGTIEEYRLTEHGNLTMLEIQIKTHPDFVSMFASAWPTAIESIKALRESGI
jgi:uncharacterized protein YndB with AHSA1/START domain